MFRRVREARRILAQGDLAVEEAKSEVRSKSGEEVDRETALKWAARAVASYELVAKAKGLRARVERFSEADDYRHEALEHAGTSGSTETHRRVAKETASAREKALATFGEDD